MSKNYIFAFPIACILIRTILRPILYSKLQIYTPHVAMVTEYIANSMCLVALSVEIFSILFLVGLVKNIVIVLLILPEFILTFEHLFAIVYMVLPYSVGG